MKNLIYALLITIVIYGCNNSNPAGYYNNNNSNLLFSIDTNIITTDHSDTNFTGKLGIIDLTGINQIKVTFDYYKYGDVKYYWIGNNHYDIFTDSTGFLNHGSKSLIADIDTTFNHKFILYEGINSSNFPNAGELMVLNFKVYKN